MNGNGYLVISPAELHEALEHWFTNGIGTNRQVGKPFVVEDVRHCRHEGSPHWKVTFEGARPEGE